MECGPIVKAGLRQLLEILNRLGRDVGPEFGHHFAFARLDHRYLIRGVWCIHNCVLLFFFRSRLARYQNGTE